MAIARIMTRLRSRPTLSKIGSSPYLAPRSAGTLAAGSGASRALPPVTLGDSRCQLHRPRRGPDKELNENRTRIHDGPRRHESVSGFIGPVTEGLLVGAGRARRSVAGVSAGQRPGAAARPASVSLSQ